MLAAVQLATFLRVGPSWASVAALVVVVSALCFGGALSSRAIRRRPSLQLTSSAILGLSGLPIEVALGRPLADALTTSLAWVALFTSSALLVRAAFARSRKRGPSPVRLEAAAVVLTALAGVGCALAQATSQAAALAVAAVCLALVSRARSTPKQLKQLGIALAGTAALVAVVLVSTVSP